MGSVPHVDAGAAVATGVRLMPPGPARSPAQARALVSSLRRAAAASVQPVADVTRLDATAAGPMRIVDRASWLQANVTMAVAMVAEASAEHRAPQGLRERLAARANGAQLGAVLAALGTRILGQWLPFAPEPQLLLVAPNVAKVEASLGVRPRDFRLWVCLHEQTHRLQFARAPWLRDHLIGEMALLLADGDAAAGPERPHSLVEAALSPDQRVVFARVGAVMALLEGYADDMMDRVGPDVVPTVAHIRRTFEARRHRGGAVAVLNRLLGMDVKLAQYRDGARFCRAVIGRVGVDGLNAAYDAPAHLPSAAEIADPARWVRRVHG
ncbi:zinc-dependent metalloprotease [Propioniciclava soli]|uniref:Zinc-dependent metalloprotease n=1 Tax=Propioniciclava soli TaxID=2775081 RepID=A0ABZ3CA43_9ACTN